MLRLSVDYVFEQLSIILLSIIFSYKR